MRDAHEPSTCNLQARVFKGCREEIMALTEVKGVKSNRVRFVRMIQVLLRVRNAGDCQQGCIAAGDYYHRSGGHCVGTDCCRRGTCSRPASARLSASPRSRPRRLPRS